MEILEASKVKKISLYIYTQRSFNPVVKTRHYGDCTVLSQQDNDMDRLDFQFVKRGK